MPHLSPVFLKGTRISSSCLPCYAAHVLMDDFKAFPVFLALLQVSTELIHQNISSFRVYSVEIGSSGTGLQEVVQDIL